MEPDVPNNVMVVSENGFGKRSELDDYRITNRGGKGVKTINVTDKTGRLVAIKSVNDDNDLVIINRRGITLRMKVADIRVQGRATQGVRVINLEKRNDVIASVCCVNSDNEESIEQLVDGASTENPVDAIPLQDMSYDSEQESYSDFDESTESDEIE